MIIAAMVKRESMSNPKITVLPYASPRCVECGRDLPKGRKARCHYCRPPKPHRPPPDPKPDLEYTLADRVAQAEACEISYGQLMAIVEAGKEIPLRRKVRWPQGSDHVGE